MQPGYTAPCDTKMKKKQKKSQHYTIFLSLLLSLLFIPFHSIFFSFYKTFARQISPCRSDTIFQLQLWVLDNDTTIIFDLISACMRDDTIKPNENENGWDAQRYIIIASMMIDWNERFYLIYDTISCWCWMLMLMRYWTRATLQKVVCKRVS